MTETDQNAWEERSRQWSQRAAAGRSEDDTFNQMIIAEAAIRPGETILDLASGTGNPAISIALAMEGQGTVTCCDFVPRMVATARQRARNLDLSIMRFACGDMRELPFAPALFDCVTCRFGIMSIDEKEAAAREARRVLKPGGRVAYMVWGPYEENPPFRVPRRTIAEFLGESEGAPPPRHSMGQAGAIRDVLEAAGLQDAEERELRYERRVDNIDDYVSSAMRRGLGDRADALPADRMTALKGALLEAWQPYIRDGILWVPNYARLGIAWLRE